MTRHVYTNIKGMLRNNSDHMLGRLFDRHGPTLRKELRQMIADGHKYLPSEGCKHFNPQTGCECHLYTETN